MPDPRNIAHDKKVQEEKKHHHEEPVAHAAVTPQPGKKPPLEKEPAEGHDEPNHGHHDAHHKGDEA